MGWLSSSPAPAESKNDTTSGLLRFFNPSTPDPEFPASTFLNHVSHGYDKNELAYACIVEKATSGPEAPVRVYDALGRRGEPIEDHPMRRLLASPNPLLSEYELFELLYLHLDLAGNGFWEVVRDRAGTPVELWPLRPDLVRMKRGTRQVSYGYVVGGRTVPVEAIHFKLPNPVDPMVGTPPMRAALRATALDNEATDFVKALLQNSAVPGVVVTMSDLQHVLDQETTNRLKAMWKSAYGGRKRGEPAFLQTGMDVKQLGLNLKDLEFPDLRTISESRICMSFGVPPILVGAKVGLDRSTFANYAEARVSFWEETLMPLQRRIRDTLERQLLPMFPSGAGRRRVILRNDTSEVLALKESESARWTRATEGLRAGGMTMNDWRREVGLPEVPGGEVFLMPSGVIATRDAAGELQQVGTAQPATQPDPKPDPDPPADDAKAALRDRETERAEAALVAYLEGRRADVLGQIHGKAVGIDPATWNANLTGVLATLGLAASSAAGASTSETYDIERTKAYQHRRAENAAKALNYTIAERAREALVSPDPHAAVADLFDALKASTAQQIAAEMTDESLAWGVAEAGRQASRRDHDTTE
ncbi:phage portal protein [Luteipulveratus mongoliensis]|uniref:Phage portal protein n=1 Tax=Luteipulveratus mongoliensis TaxID=571913 RepID=A0A0K1JGC7_9MICO|nr:phage portal protein [Luteipulveratus mongoliensis]AKU15754.1 hypothetical protein VV02_07640 [Luteipulveratus mongoliensis]